jgi:2,3-bisphosphoglycerate-independent phosphoglycerate mutase
MAAHEVTDGVLKAIDSDKFEVIVMNLANPDMVGHTGEFDATVKAIKTVDDCLGLIVKKVLEKDGILFVTADHGNAEKMEDPETGAKFTAHTTNKVPFIMVTNEKDTFKLHDGKLADIAPTMLEVMEIPQPDEMTGISLLDK